MAESDLFTIEFPCDWSLRIIGPQADNFETMVREVLADHCDELRNVRLKLSREGRYTSLNCVITATGEPQLKALHQALLATGQVKLVL